MERMTSNNSFDSATLDAVMERYRAELLRYQRATAPGRPTLEDNLKQLNERQQAAALPPQESAAPIESGYLRQPQSRAEDNLKQLNERQQAAALPQESAAPIESGYLRQPQSSAFLQQPQEKLLVSGALTPPHSPAVRQPKALVDKATPPPLCERVRASANAAQPLAERAALSDIADMPEGDIFDQEAVLANERVYKTTERTVPPPSELLETLNEPVPQELPEEPAPERATEPSSEAASPPPLLQAPQMTPPQLTAERETPKKTDTCAGCSEQQAETAEDWQKKRERMLSICGCSGHTEYEKCTGAYGIFRPYERMSAFTAASFLQTPGEAVRALVRFAADQPTGGSDCARCRRSFSVKFFCPDGEYDLLGQHLPVCAAFSEEALKQCCEAFRANKRTGLRSKADFWRFVTDHNEALHMALWLYLDLGTIGSYRSIDAYSQTAIWVNPRGRRFAVRCRWLSRQRPQTLSRFEAEELAGFDPDAAARDLINAIALGEKPQYELGVQVISDDDKEKLECDPFDPTVIWSEQLVPVRRIGLLSLESMPDDMNGELAAERFSREHIIPGIEYPPPVDIRRHDDFLQVGSFIRSLNEQQRRSIISNLSADFSLLPPSLLEQALILVSRADLETGRALTSALGG